ncbi:GPN-loop GTPase QQT1 [Senna tora]|uniref:GPN-loop GTPase QQT1 n=1 Tax=Senna tora TaxID=362788 RepID=A0A834WS01_9FABA|nr:GPN-loop GTPase QQT1 [Senna tora]
MLNYFVCGGTFHHEEHEAEARRRIKTGSDSSSPRKSSKKTKSHDKKNGNPYSTRGLDKFSALLADLDEKRQKIYSQMSPQDISFVRFAYTSTDDFVPVVVKVKNKLDQRNHKSEELIRVRRVPDPLIDHEAAIESSSVLSVEESRKHNSESDRNKAESKKNKRRRISDWISWRRPSFYLPVVMILILVMLTIVGRSAATLCTCIVWYVVPTLKESSKPRRSMKKKDYVRGSSEKKMVVSDNKTPRKHGHQKSWQEQFDNSAAGRAARAQQQAMAKQSSNTNKGEPVLKLNADWFNKAVIANMFKCSHMSCLPNAIPFFRMNK